jgi:hypothetical protein
MTNFKQCFSPQKVLDRLSDLLSDEHIAKIIDEPMDLAAHTFQVTIALPINSLKFKHIISAFARHLYRSALPLPRYLSDQESLTEAVYLLESYYQNEGARGYDGALLDAVSTNIEGFELLLSRLTDSIKSAERAKYVKWVFADNFFNLDWKQQHRIVSLYLRQNEAAFPAELCDLAPARLVDCFQKLFITYMSTESMVRQFLSVERYQSVGQWRMMLSIID